MSAFENEMLGRIFQFVKENVADLDDIDLADTLIPIKTYQANEISRENFQKKINDRHHTPFVVKGLISDTPSVKDWSHEYLMENFREVLITVSNESSGGDEVKKMSLSDIVRSQLDSKHKNSFYINNSAEIFNSYPDLISDVGADKVLELFDGHSINSFCQMFVGNLRTWGTNWHMGNDISCALMVSGSKRWYFIDPRLAYILKPMLDGANGMLTNTDVRLDLNFQKIHNPLYAYAPKFYLDLEPGDALFFTKYWPHSVINTTDLQIMVNMRMTEANLEELEKGYSASNLLPVYDSILNSDPEYIKFKFDIFKNLGKKEKKIGDDNYFSAYQSVNDALEKKS